MLIGLMERRRGGVDINILQLQLMNSVIKLFIDKMSSIMYKVVFRHARSISY